MSSSYAKILGETDFQTREFPRSGSKVEDVKEERRAKVNDYNGQYLSPEPIVSAGKLKQILSCLFGDQVHHDVKSKQ